MKKIYIKKILAFLLIVSFLFNPIFVYAKNVDYYSGQEKGSLSCPNGVSSDKCKMYDKSNNPLDKASNDVVKVVVTEKNGDITLTKTVSKTATLGRYKVEFSVKSGREITQTVPKDNYIVIIRDGSTSLTSTSLTQSQARIPALINDSSFGDNYNFAIIQFGNNVSKNSSSSFFHKLAPNYVFCNKNNYSDANCKHGKSDNIGSRIDLALKKAYELLKDTPADSNRWVIIVGDGRYYLPQDMNGSSHAYGNYVGPQIRNLDTLKVKYHGIFYYGHVTGDFSGSIGLDVYNKNGYYKGKGSKICKSGSTKYKSCDENVMKDMTGNNYTLVTNGNEWEQVFKNIKSEISSTGTTNSNTVLGSLTDNIGSHFTTTDNKRVVSTSLGPLGRTEAKTSFEIIINPGSVKGWHNTNNGFTLTVEKDASKTIISSINPEVYWEPETRDFSKCSESINSNFVSTEENTYYSEYCEEGWGNTKGLSSTLSTNNLKDGTKAFTVEKGFGFPLSLSLESNVRCTYTFDGERFKNDYNQRQQIYNNTSDSKEKAWYLAELTNMQNVLNNYKKIASGLSLENYKDDFDKQNAVMTIKYKNSNLREEIRLINNTTNYGNVSCQNTGNVNIGISGLSNTVNSVCTISLKKEMILPKTCINIRTSDAESCESGAITQLIGGNKYYVNMEETAGNVSIQIPEAGYFKSKIKLEGEKKSDKEKENCSFSINDTFTSKKESLIYRQIDVRDPFVQSFNEIDKRNIGRNYYNDKYNFVNIIDADIWGKEYKYLYSLSKTNVKNIKNSTLSQNVKVSSYLGTDCYIKKETNEYLCPFIRNNSGTNGNNQDYFSDYIIK